MSGLKTVDMIMVDGGKQRRRAHGRRWRCSRRHAYARYVYTLWVTRRRSWETTERCNEPEVKYALDVQRCFCAYKLVNVCSRIALEEVAVW